MTKEELQNVREALKRLTTAAEIHGDQFKPDNQWHQMSDKGTEALALIDTALAQTEQEPVIGTKTWWVDGKLFTQCLYPSDVYKDAAPVAQPYPAQWATFLHYPDCWDTAAYPTLEDAIHEALAWSRCTECWPAHQEPTAAHTDHPMRHWDRTCPACQAAPAAQKELDMPKIGCVQHDCDECKARAAAQPLTREQISDIAMQSGAYDEQLLAFARAIETEFSRKNGINLWG